MIEKLTNLMKQKIGEDFDSIAEVYENEENYGLSLNSKNENIEMPFVFVSKNDFSTLFFPMAKIMIDDNYLKGYELIYPFDPDQEDDYE